MNAFGTPNRLLKGQGQGKRKIGIWPVLVVLLLGLNVYLFGIRGLPAKGDEENNPAKAARTAPAPEAAVALVDPKPAPKALSSTPAPAPGSTSAGSGFLSGLGEMRGVAGIREHLAAAAGASLPSPGSFGQSLSQLRKTSQWQPAQEIGRFNIQAAQGVAGQRTLEQWCHPLRGRIANGDSLSTALLRQGIEAGQVSGIVQALKPVFDFRHCRPGDRFQALLEPGGRVHQFVYHKTPLLAYRVDRQGSELSGSRQDREAQVELADIAVRIRGSLWQSLNRAGERGSLVMMIVDIFAWDIDFYVDTHPGDTIRLLVEKHRVDGQFVGYGKIVAAEYAGVVGVHRAFWYEGDSAQAQAAQTRGYFDEDGGSLRKAFLKSPLKFARVSSRYGMRVHPVLGFNKMHHGVDFSAPVGTPVWAPADGTVLWAGRKGANGILVTIRHANGYQTAYAHLSKIAKGIRRGTRVRQKQVIAKVGNTGRSTGPHLHYGMKLRGRNVNPLGQKFPPAKPVPQKELEGYKKTIAPLRQRLLKIDLPAVDRTAAASSSGKKAG